MKLLVFDVETGGLNPLVNGITQVSAQAIDLDEITGAYSILGNFNTLVKPCDGLEYSDESMQVSGLTKEKLEQEGKDEREVIVGLSKWVVHYFGEAKKAQPVGHNVAFDMAFMEAARERSNVDMPFGYAHICTMHLFRAMRLAGYHGSYKANLPSVCKELGIEFNELEAHNSMYDCSKTAECLARMVHMMRQGAGGLL